MACKTVYLPTYYLEKANQHLFKIISLKTTFEQSGHLSGTDWVLDSLNHELKDYFNELDNHHIQN